MTCLSCRSQTCMSIYFGVIIVALTVLLTGCEEPGVVGSDIADEGANVRIDTLKIEDYNLTSEPPVFTGNRTYISAGRYEDQLFGDLTATSVIRPSLDASMLDTLHPDAEFMLELKISRENVYGDTTSTSEFEFREISRSWRGTAWRLDSPVEVNQTVVNAEPVQIGMQDSVVVPLSASWYQKYRDFFYDNSSS